MAAFSFDGTTRRVYTNGALENEIGVLFNEAPAESEISATANPLLIGGWAHPAGNRFASKGFIDEAAVFNVALSQAVDRTRTVNCRHTMHLLLHLALEIVYIQEVLFQCSLTLRTRKAV